jgi:hypothetical protein
MAVPIFWTSLENDKIIISAKGYVLPQEQGFLVGYHIDFGSQALDIIVEKHAFATYDEAHDFLVNNTGSILLELCEKLGLSALSQIVFTVGSKQRH